MVPQNIFSCQLQMGNTAPYQLCTAWKNVLMPLRPPLDKETCVILFNPYFSRSRYSWYSLLIFNKILLYLHLCICVFIYVCHVCAGICQGQKKEGFRSSGSEVAGSGAACCRCRDPHLDPLAL